MGSRGALIGSKQFYVRIVIQCIPEHPASSGTPAIFCIARWSQSELQSIGHSMQLTGKFWHAQQRKEIEWIKNPKRMWFFLDNIHEYGMLTRVPLTPKFSPRALLMPVLFWFQLLPITETRFVLIPDDPSLIEFKHLAEANRHTHLWEFWLGLDKRTTATKHCFEDNGNLWVGRVGLTTTSAWYVPSTGCYMPHAGHCRAVPPSADTPNCLLSSFYPHFLLPPPVALIGVRNNTHIPHRCKL